GPEPRRARAARRRPSRSRAGARPGRAPARVLAQGGLVGGVRGAREPARERVGARRARTPTEPLRRTDAQAGPPCPALGTWEERDLETRRESVGYAPNPRPGTSD